LWTGCRIALNFIWDESSSDRRIDMSDRIHPALKKTGIDWENVSRNLNRKGCLKGEGSAYSPNLKKMVSFKYEHTNEPWGYYFNPVPKVPEEMRS
jgi:hypothetical protein